MQEQFDATGRNITKIFNTLAEFQQNHDNHKEVEQRLRRDIDKLNKVVNKNRDQANEALIKAKDDL